MSCDMTQKWFDRWLSDRSLTLPAEVARHLTGCGTCQGMIALLRQKDEMPVESNDVQVRVSETLRTSLKAVKPLPSRANLVARVVICLIASAAGIASWTGWVGMSSLSWDQTVLLATLTLFALFMLAYSLSTLLEPGASMRISPAAAMVAASAAILCACAIPFSWNFEEGLALVGWGCGRVVAAGTVPVLVILLVATRRGVIIHPVQAAGALVGAAALAPLASIQFACQAHEATHLIAWHWGIWFVLMVVAVFGVALISGTVWRKGKG